MSAILNIKPLGFPWETQDPFLFCVHHLDHFPEGNEKMGPDPSLLRGRSMGNDFVIKDGFRMYHGMVVPGFPSHPHSGFETVTIARQGFIDHSDSLGAAARFGNGDIQWMTAGSGVQHSEMFPLLNKDKENTGELFQIWLNLPAKSKDVDPHFKMLWGEDVPHKTLTDTNGKKVDLTCVAGSLEGMTAPDPAPNSWAADPENDVAIWTIKMEAGAQWTLPKAEKNVNRSLYFFTGETITIDGQEFNTYRAVELDSTQDVPLENGNQETELLLLQGKPIGEPVAQYGPFVQTSQEGIQKTMQEYQRTQFGGWPWPKSDNTHAREKGRFAIHADGTEEVRD